jgi:hypothetical protein
MQKRRKPKLTTQVRARVGTASARPLHPRQPVKLVRGSEGKGDPSQSRPVTIQRVIRLMKRRQQGPAVRGRTLILSQNSPRPSNLPKLHSVAARPVGPLLR